VLLRYVATSIVTALVDFVVFLMITATGGTIFWATMGARAVALWLQFALLQEFVFKKRGGIAAFTIYVSYVAFTGVVSSILQIQFRPYLFNSIVLTKIVIEGLLWLFGFLFLRDFAFRRDTD
jgi:putative flippase GtrA